MAVHPSPPPPSVPRLGSSASGHHSVVRLADQWFIACESRSLRDRPRAATVQDVPLVLFRDGAGRPGALEDRCPHRNAPLTAGRVRGGELQCAYHGWRFDAGGACVAVPGLAGPPEARATRATAFPCVESDGFVWVYTTSGGEPVRSPPRFPHAGEPGFTTVRRVYDVRATMLAALENVLDVPHTAFLHGGLFRTAKQEREIEVVVRRFGDRAEAEFLGEPRPKGLAARLLAPGGGVVTHFDRFLLPSLAQVEYRLGEASQLVVTTAMTPLDAFRTRFHSVVTFRLPLPGWLVAPFVAPVGAAIFRQDARILRLVTDNVQRFGGERFATTELDVLGPQIWRLLRQAERGEVAAPQARGARPEHEHVVRMRL